MTFFLAHQACPILGDDRFFTKRSGIAEEATPARLGQSRAAPPPQGRWRISGLRLPGDVPVVVRAGNAARLIPGL